MGDLDLKEKDYVWNQPKREVKLRIIDLIAQIEPRAKHFTYIIWCNHRNNFPRQLWLSTRQQRKLLRNLPKGTAGKCQSWCSTPLLPDVKACAILTPEHTGAHRDEDWTLNCPGKCKRWATRREGQGKGSECWVVTWKWRAGLVPTQQQ